MIFFISILFVDFANVNRDGCENNENGYSCSDIDNGIELLNKRINEKKKNNFVHVIPKKNNDESNKFANILESIVALRTNSRSYNEKMKESIEKNEKENDFIKNMHYENYSLCFENATLDYNVTYYVDALPSLLLLTPPSVFLCDELGPAYLHLIAHYSLSNLSFNQTKVLTDKASIIKYCPRSYEIEAETNFEKLIYRGKKYFHQIGSLKGWLGHIFSGTSPYLFDPVSKSCWNGTTYLAGGISATYTGTQRSNNDLQRMNSKCKNISNVKKMLKYIL